MQPPPVPKLPGALVKLFEQEPKNFPGIVPELSDPKAFLNAIANWNKQGVLYATDIIREGEKNGHSVDFHAKVGKNDTTTGYGQLNELG